MVMISVEVSEDTAAKLRHRAAENGRSLVEECLFILSSGGSTFGDLFPGKSGDALILPSGGSTQGATL